MTLPPSDFAAAFLRHVVPRLRAVIIHELRADHTFSEIHSAATALAVERGATRLPAAHLETLLEWIDLTILDEQERQFEADYLVASLIREPSRAVMREKIQAYISG